MENIEKQLEKLGLSKKEADVYLAVLKLKEATIVQLAKITNIKRTTVYHLIDGLMEKGLISKTIKDDKKYYLAEDPKESLSNLLAEKKNIINSLAPELKNIFGQGALVPGIRIYRNRSGIKKIFDDILTCEEKLCRYYIHSFNIEDLLGERAVDDFVKKRIALGIKSLSLRSFKYKPAREKGLSHAKQLREIKFLPENASIKPYICVYDNKVVVISTKEEKMGFIIESKEFADAQKAIFDMIWNNAAM